MFCLDHEKFEGKYEEREWMKKGKIRRKSNEENTNWFKFNNFFIQCLSNCAPLLETKNGEFRNIEANILFFFAFPIIDHIRKFEIPSYVFSCVPNTFYDINWALIGEGKS